MFTCASVLCGFAASTLMLQLSRGLQGVGGAIMFAVSLALLADAFRGRDRGVAFGVWGTVTGLAVAIGPLLGGVLTSGLSWRYIFVNVPIGIAAVAITMTRVAESRAPQASRPDWPGFVVFTVALSSLVYGLIESNQRSFTDPLVLGCLAAAAALLIVYVEVRRPADAEAYRKRTLAEAERDQARFAAEAEAFSKRAIAEAEAEANKARAASLREGNQELIAADRIIEILPAMVEAAARGLAESNLTILNCTQGVNEVVAGLVGQGLSIFDTLKKAAPVTGNGAAPARVPRAPGQPSIGAD